MLVVISQSGNGKGVFLLTDFFVSFLAAVAAGVIGHYIIKWLDSRKNDN